MTNFEVGVSRHASKIDQPRDEEGVFDVTNQNIDTEKAAAEAMVSAEILLKQIKEGPDGLITALESSNIERAKQTKDCIIQALRKSAAGADTIECVEIPDDKEEANKFLSSLREKPLTKFIITNLRSTELVGFKEQDQFVEAVNKWKKVFKGDENLVAKLWAAHPHELENFAEEIKAKGIKVEEKLNPTEFAMTPEDRAWRMIRWITFMKELGGKYFPQRPTRLEGISHNIASDFAFLKLLGEDISVSSINNLLGGELRQSLERSSVKFDDERIVVEYREMQKVYSQEEFTRLLEKIRRDSEIRKEEWQEFSN
jgi:hypothetical protein